MKRAGPLLVGALRRLQPSPWLRPRPRWAARAANARVARGIAASAPLAMALACQGRAALEAPAIKREGPLLVGALRRRQPSPWLRPRPRWAARAANARVAREIAASAPFGNGACMSRP